ncbi:MAG: hydrogenase 2 maturation protease [Candidatus Magnetoglobus multicellularis str. Araruama]|uniref:Hydrogenase 2 maturation protease n=1 Tax=Candidatus Magnetoglobus multicellularis str. Araruama TaxID=890399 RepID=A0A1V1P445_9BACT|nr:MAG: hydrogenase 2 maturation protease [Candidatus Magnetoglobus multicellularis str. Araruama]
MEVHKPEYKQIAIVGIGNILQKDDGIGVTLIKYLESAYTFPSCVHLIDSGTSGVAIQSQIMKKDVLIIIDALSVSDIPGTVHVLTGDFLLSQTPDIKLSPHQISFFDLLQFMALQKIGPKELVIVGIVPEDIGCGVDLSMSVEQCIENASNQIIGILMQRGIHADKNINQLLPDYWWKEKKL